MLLVFILLVIILVLSLLYLNGFYNESYWNKRGVPFYKKNKVIGPMWEFLVQDRPLFQILHDIYKQYPKDPAVGFGSFVTPCIYVKDTQNIQHVLQSDFQSFNHRALEVNKNDILADNILFMHGNRWKLVRQNMTPLFTATKLKNMYYIMDKSAKDFVQFLKLNQDKLKSDPFETMSTFCSAAIAAAVFGIGTNSVFDSPLLAMAKNTTKPSFRTNLKFAIASVSRSLFRYIGLNFFKEHEDLFIGAIKQVLRQKEKELTKKHDFGDLCVSIQKSGPMKDSETGLEIDPTDELLAAQGFFFFVAGVEPSATAIYSTFIGLSRNPEILEKVHTEIDETFDKYNGELSYDAIMEMNYLDKVLSEALRRYPPIGFLTRECVRDSVLPVGNIKIDKGTRIFTPIYEIHHDPDIYPNPYTFDPERFDQDPKNGDITYMPFGKGGRICVGMRYARLQVKTGLVHILRNFTLKPVSGEYKIKFSKQQVQVRPIDADIEFIPRTAKSYKVK